MVPQRRLQYLSDLMSPVTCTCEKKKGTNVSRFLLCAWSFHLLIPFLDSQITLFQHRWILRFKQTVPAMRSWCRTEAPALYSSQGVSTLGCSPWLQPRVMNLPHYTTYHVNRGKIISSHQLLYGIVRHHGSMLRSLCLTKNTDLFTWYYRANYFKKVFSPQASAV